MTRLILAMIGINITAAVISASPMMMTAAERIGDPMTRHPLRRHIRQLPPVQDRLPPKNRSLYRGKVRKTHRNAGTSQPENRHRNTGGKMKSHAVTLE